MAERNLNFDEVIDRRNTQCLKYDFAERRGMPADVLPLWVADMDFRTSSYVEDALTERTAHGIFGYSETKDEYFDLVRGWFLRRHRWEVQRPWLIKTPGVVFALAMAVKAFSEPGEAVLIQSPVYYPFSEVIRANGRRVVSSDLILGEDHRYHMNLEDFEEKIRREHIRLFLLCSPHNPAARVWTREELTAVGDLCVRYGVTVVSDEIHEDFVFRGEHHVFASLKKEYEDISVICTAPSKTFNLAGLIHSNLFIPNPQLRHRFRHEMDAAGISQIGIMGITACEAAYRDGDEWYEAMHRYVGANIDFVQDWVERKMPGVTMVEHEGTYLVWLDFRETGLNAEELDRRIIYEAKLWLDSGKIFGDSGQGFQRINVACPRSILQECMERLTAILPG